MLITDRSAQPLPFGGTSARSSGDGKGSCPVESVLRLVALAEVRNPGTEICRFSDTGPVVHGKL